MIYLIRRKILFSEFTVAGNINKINKIHLQNQSFPYNVIYWLHNYAALYCYVVSIHRLIGIENKFTAYHRGAMMFECNELNTDNDDDKHGGSDVDCQ